MTYYIITIGCWMNVSDSERLATKLNSLGFKLAVSRKKADVVFLNTCGIRQGAEDRVYGLIPRMKKENPQVKIVLTGCLSQRADVKKRLPQVDLWLPIVDLPRLNRKLQIEADKANGCLSDYLKIQPKYQSKFSAFVPIGNGCNNFCSYCVVPYARGREEYRDPKEILNECQQLLQAGFQEIVLIAQNVNSYQYQLTEDFVVKGKNIPAGQNIKFPELLQAVSDLSFDFWLEFSSSHPKDMSDDLISVWSQSSKCCPHIHLPAQSGSDRILKAMNRKYTQADYLDLIRKIKKARPDALLTTDIIVGFPGETEEDFQQTADLFRQINFDMAYISQYSPRPGTVAFKLEDNVSKTEKKRREEILTELLSASALKNSQKFLGKTVEILVNRSYKDIWLGKTASGKTVKFEKKAKDNFLGQRLFVKIIKAETFGLKAKRPLN